MKSLFQELDFFEVNEANHAEFVAKPGLKALFFWGHQCPNCDFAKKSLSENQGPLCLLPILWAQCNAYEYIEVAKAYGLHGIPAFLFFKDGKRLGKVSPYPGFDPFFEVLEKLTRDKDA